MIKKKKEKKKRERDGNQTITVRNKIANALFMLLSRS